MEMRPSRLGSVFLVALMSIMLSSCGSTRDASDEETITEVRAATAAYVEAISRGDADAAADCWDEGGRFANVSTGVQISGRASILDMLREVLSPENPIKAETMSVNVQCVSPEVMTVEGRSRFAPEMGPVEHAKFVALYVKRDNAWKIHRLWQTDLAVPSHYERLASVSWMIGEWTDEQDGKKITNVCRWSRNRNFITRTFEVSDDMGLLNKGTEIIGWDPDRKQIRSWTFDIKGGVADTLWRFSGGEWLPTETQDVKPGDLTEHRAALAELAWMTGRWVDRDEDQSVETTCGWSENEAFLVQRYKASLKSHPAQEGICAIGWDPKTARIRSWMFDTDGGFCESTWSRSKDAWQVSNRHVLPDGRLASSATVYRKVNDNTFTWQRVAQELDGELLPDGPEIRVVRDANGS